MQGVTWGERKTGWWLASNGRWYAPEHYPGGWSTSALPPAPEHRSRQSAAAMITQRTKRLRETVSEALESAAESDADPFHRSPPPPPMASPSWSAAPPPPRSRSGPAEATVRSASAYSSRLSSGTPPPPALAAPEDDFPDPPGRFSDDGPIEDAE